MNMISIGMIVNGAFSSASAADEYRLNEAGRATAPSRNALTSRRGLPVHVKLHSPDAREL
jgi:hypothetical protein